MGDSGSSELSGVSGDSGSWCEAVVSLESRVSLVESRVVLVDFW